METKEEFMSCVKKDAKTGCWNWIGSIHKSTRYARLRWRGKDTHGHRVGYELFRGKIPKGLQLDHLCRNRQCVNPEHLEAVTRYENIIRGEWGAGVNKRKTHCKHGHEFTPENTGRSKNGRYCKECHRRRGRETYRRAAPNYGKAKIGRPRQVECRRGHKFTADNTYFGNDGSRRCKKCMRFRATRNRAARATNRRSSS